MFDRDDIPWDHPVEMFEAGPGVVVNVREMTLRRAVECFRDMPQDERWGYGVGVHNAFLTTINSRPVAVGFLNASTLTEMIGLLPAE
jgi:hypothetical protein